MTPPRKKAEPTPLTLSVGDRVGGSVSDTFIFRRKQQIVTVRVETFTVRPDHESDEAVMAELSELLAKGMERIKGDHTTHLLEGRY